MFCHSCGHSNPAGVNYCSACGAMLASLTDTTVIFAPDDQAVDLGEEELGIASASVARGSGILLVKRGPDAGASYVLERDVTCVGRHPESDIFLDDITVSRRHAEFHRSTSGEKTLYVLKDVGSLNGTYVNRERIDQVELTSGDEVQIGKFKLVFLAPQAA